MNKIVQSLTFISFAFNISALASETCSNTQVAVEGTAFASVPIEIETPTLLKIGSVEYSKNDVEGCYQNQSGSHLLSCKESSGLMKVGNSQIYIESAPNKDLLLFSVKGDGSKELTKPYLKIHEEMANVPCKGEGDQFFAVACTSEQFSIQMIKNGVTVGKLTQDTSDEGPVKKSKSAQSNMPFQLHGNDIQSGGCGRAVIRTFTNSSDSSKNQSGDAGSR